MDQSPIREVKPLAPFICSTRYDNIENPNTYEKRKIVRIRKFILCCGCVTALILILAVIVLVLGFTVYNVKEPRVRMNGVTLLKGTFTNGATNNITLLADVSVKNPNAFTFRFGTTTTTVYYDGTGIGEGRTPPGKAKARRTIRFNVTMEVIGEKVLGNGNWERDVRDQAVNISSYTKINGKVKILNMFKRKVVVELNCTIGYNITTGLTAHGDNCIRRLDV